MPGATDAKRERRAAAIEMLRGGASIETIVTVLGYGSRGAAQRDINRVLIEVSRVPFDEQRALELSRLDGLMLAHWPAARRGEMAATEKVLKIIAERARILGLYAPTRTESITMDAIEAEIERIQREQMSGPPERGFRGRRKQSEESPGVQG